MEQSISVVSVKLHRPSLQLVQQALRDAKPEEEELLSYVSFLCSLYHITGGAVLFAQEEIRSIVAALDLIASRLRAKKLEFYSIFSPEEIALLSRELKEKIRLFPSKATF